MIWLAWRQQRLLILTGVGIMALLAAAAVWLRWDVAAFITEHGTAADCLSRAAMLCEEDFANAFHDRYGVVQLVLADLVRFGPPGIGLICGVGVLVRDFERGTQVLALTQGVSRFRWATTKIAVSLLPLLAMTLILGFVHYGARLPFSDGGDSMLIRHNYAVVGLIVAAYFLTAFTIAVVAGLLLRRTLAALVVGVVLLVGIVLSIQSWVRPHLIPANSMDQPAALAQTEGFDVPWGSLSVGVGYTDSHGRPVTDAVAACGGQEDCLDLAEVETVTWYYIPHERFWDLQFAETGLYLALSAVLLAIGAAWLRFRPVAP